MVCFLVCVLSCCCPELRKYTTLVMFCADNNFEKFSHSLHYFVFITALIK